jgi:LysM repeat protein
MQEQRDIRFNQASNEETNPPEKEKRGGFNKSNIPLPILGIGLGVLIVVAAVFFFSSKGTLTEEETRQMQAKMMDLAEKLAAVEKKVEDLNARMPTAGSESEILQRLKDLGQKVESLEKRSQPAAAHAKPAVAKSAVPAQKQFYTVHKGDTLSSISKKYKISVKELRKLNNLPENQGLRSGQKLLVAPG